MEVVSVAEGVAIVGEVVADLEAGRGAEEKEEGLVVELKVVCKEESGGEENQEESKEGEAEEAEEAETFSRQRPQYENHFRSVRTYLHIRCLVSCST
jgi:hypothetical protein